MTDVEDQAEQPTSTVSLQRYQRLRHKVASLEKLMEERTAHLFRLSEEMGVAHHYLSRIIDGIADALLVLGPGGEIQLSNPAARKMLAMEKDALGQRNIAEFLFPGSGLDALDFLHAGVGAQSEATMRAADGRETTVRCTVSNVPGTAPVGPEAVDLKDEVPATIVAGNGQDEDSFVLLAQDISERTRVREEMEHLARFTEESPILVMRISTEMKLVYANPAADQMLGALGLELGGSLPEALVWPARSALERGEREQTGEKVDGRHYDLLFVPFPAKGYVNVYGTDVTGRVEAEAQLIQNAFYDILTGLPNRALLKDHVEHAIRTFQREPARRFALMAINVDRFKFVNETYGHAVGDQLLVECARIFSACFRARDTVAHFSGDSFCVLQTGVEDDGAVLATARRVMEAFEPVVHVGEHAFHITVSIGIACSDPNTSEPDAVIRDADTALHRAKSLGRGRYVVFDQTMHERMGRTLLLESKLRRAIEQGAFEMFYQPKVSTCDALLQGFEALIRWKDPDEGFISPVEFIPVAEETGLIIPLSDWIHRDVCRQIAEWSKLTDRMVPVAVNCSGKQFAQRDFVERFRAVLEEFHVPPTLVNAEITESSLVEDVDRVVLKLRELAELGVRTSIDDFGTGYSSLAYLKMFPAHMLKIDRSFIKDMHENEDDLEITGAIIAMAHRLGMEVVAEGVENETQLTMLLGMNCEQVQGYYFSPPVAAQFALKMIQAGVTNCAL